MPSTVDTSPAGLDALEQAVLDALLAGDHPVLAILRQQAARARVASRELSGVGFFVTFEVPDDVERIAASRVTLHDVEARVAGLAHGAGFVLFVEDGRLSMLEGFAYAESWPATITEFTLRYEPSPRSLADLPPAP